MIGAEHPGIIAGWYLDNNANDAKGGFNGTASNITYTKDAYARHGYYGEFNGTNSRIAIGAGPRPASQFTFACWHRYTGTPQAGTFFANYAYITSKYYGFYIGTNAGNIINCGVAKGTGQVAGTDLATAGGATALPADKWNHIAATYDGSAIRVYLNGRYDGGNGWTGGIVYNAAALAMLGCQQQQSAIYSVYLKGKMDQPMVWDRAFTPNQIRKQYAWELGKLI